MGKAHRLYKITGGDVNGKVNVTCVEIAEFCGLPRSTIYSRLSRDIVDLEQLIMPVKHRGAPKKKKKKTLLSTNRILLNKPFYDPMYRLMMKAI